MRLVLVALLTLVAAGAATRVSHPRLREYRRKAVGRQAVVGAGGSAALGTLRNSPRQWGRGPAGAVKRFGSSLGQHVAKESIQFGVAAAHHENLHYQRSRKHGTLPRMGDAVKHTFIVPKTNRPGKKTVALGRVSGNLGAGMVSQAWKPAAGVGAGLASGGIGLGADVGVNMAREFWPRKHPARRRSTVTAARRRARRRPG